MTTDSRCTADTASAAHTITRRTLLKSVAAALAVGPWVLRRGLASSGELNLYAWSDYIDHDMIDAFTAKTGIKVNLSVYGSNDEVLNKLRASNGEGFDIVMPSVTYGPVWYQYKGLLQPINENKINVDGCIPTMWEKSKRLGAVHRGRRYLCPFNWGTEALAWNSDKRDLEYGQASYADLWREENRGKVAVRAHSALLGIGLWLDRIGKLPSDQMRRTYENEAEMRRIYGEITKFAIEHKPWIRQFWSNAQEITNAFTQNGCVIGQTWDGPALRLMTETQGRVRYMAPIEGALTWMDTMAIPGGAKNVEQAYAFINWYYTPQAGAMHANKSGYNSCAAGAEEHLSAAAKANFKAAYPGDAIERLWWYPPEPAWFVPARAEFRDKFLAA